MLPTKAKPRVKTQINLARVRLVVLDLTMPRMGGAEAFAEIRKLSAGLPVLVASGYGEQEVNQRLGANAVAAFSSFASEITTRSYDPSV